MKATQVVVSVSTSGVTACTMTRAQRREQAQFAERLRGPVERSRIP